MSRLHDGTEITSPQGEALIRAAWVLTVGPAGNLPDAAIHIRDGQIVAVAPYAQLRAEHPTVRVIGDGTGIATPGFVNTHTHLSEALATGMGSELTLSEWGTEIVNPLGNVLTHSDAKEGTKLRAIELLLSGVTTVNDMFVHSNRGSYASIGVVDGLQESGLRAVVSFGAEDHADPDHPWATVDEIMAEHLALWQVCQEADLVEFRYGIGTLLGQSDEMLELGAAACKQHGWAIHTHLHETREEIVTARLRWGHRTISHAQQLGLLDNQVIAGHGVWLRQYEIDLLSEYRTGIAHNPVANSILGSGVCPVGQLQAAGVLVGIGTDGAASNDSQDMLQAIKMAALLQKVHHLDPAVIDAATVLRMATLGGAEALGMSDVVGSLEPGKRADIVLFQDVVDVAVQHDPEAQLVYGASSRSVSDVWVDGQQLVSAHRPLHIDEREQIEVCRPMTTRIAHDSGLSRNGWSVL